MNYPVIRTDLLRVHVENAGLLAWQRTLLTEAPNTRITDIYELDQRLAGNFRYLQLAGGPALAIAEEAFFHTSGQGEAIVYAALSMQANTTGYEAGILAQTETEQAAIAALAEAFRHVGRDVQRRVFYPWIKGEDPCLVSAALAAATLLRLDLGGLLLPFITDSRPLVQAYALEYAGVMGLVGHAPVAIAAVGSADADLAFAAAVASVRLGNRAAALPLVAFTAPGAPAARCRVAVELAFPLLEQEAAHAQVRVLLKAPDTHRWGLLGLGAIGSTRTLPYLLQEMEQPGTARMAGWALAMITGANVAEDDLELDVFPETEDDPLLEGADTELFFEDALPFPDPERVLDWIKSKGKNLSSEHPLLFGLPQWSWADMDSPDLQFQGRYRALAQVMSIRNAESRLPDWRTPVRLQGGKLMRDWQM